MTAESSLAIPPAYHGTIRFGANWTLITSPYSILYLIGILAIGSAEIGAGDSRRMIEIVGNTRAAFGATVLLDGLFHILFFVTVVTLFAVLRVRWPVRASLQLVGGAWQMIIGFAKALSSFFTFTSLGATYVAGDAVLRAMLVQAATAADGLRQALQQMDSYGVAVIWVLISLLPRDSGLPRAVRWLGWILAFALIGPDPGFLLVILLGPVWVCLLGLWLKRLLAAQ